MSFESTSQSNLDSTYLNQRQENISKAKDISRLPSKFYAYHYDEMYGY